MSRVNTIIFDWGNVMAPDSNRVAAKALSAEYNIDEETLHRELDSREDEYFEGEDATPYYEGLSRDFKIPAEEIRIALNNVPPRRTMMQVAAELQRQYTVAILSNQMKPKTDWIHENCDLRLFDGIFFSSKMRVKKPKKKAFLHVLERLCRTPEECLFVDDYQKYITGAYQAGMNVHLFRDVRTFQREFEF